MPWLCRTPATVHTPRSIRHTEGAGYFSGCERLRKTFPRKESSLPAKEYPKALADVGEAIRLNPRFTRAYADQAWLLATCADDRYRDGQNAVAAARKACELSAWKDPGYLSVLAAACAEAGDFKEAIRRQNQALEFSEYAKTQRRPCTPTPQAVRDGQSVSREMT